MTNGAVVYSAAVNNGFEARTGNIFVEGSGFSLTCAVVQLRANSFLYAAQSGDDAAAGTNWATAKRTIQAAVDAAADGDSIWVGDGTYFSVSNSKSIAITGVSGADYTLIRGNGGRCVYLANTGAVLSGFTLAYGRAQTGGGALIENGTLEDCIIRDNIATGYVAWSQYMVPSHYSRGGGVYGGSLRRCKLLRNSVEANDDYCGYHYADGGGAWGAHLENCLVAFNTADATLEPCGVSLARGGGTMNCTNVNSTIVGNTCVSWDVSSGGGCQGSLVLNSIIVSNSPGDLFEGSVMYSCSPGLDAGNGNISVDP